MMQQNIAPDRIRDVGIIFWKSKKLKIQQVIFLQK